MKDRTWRSEEYLAYVRTRPCVVTDLTTGVVAHHVRCLGGGGMGLKPPDWMCVPLNQSEHSFLHDKGEASYWNDQGLDPVQLIGMTMLVYLAQRTDKALLYHIADILVR
jgi:hypothetical protein